MKLKKVISAALAVFIMGGALSGAGAARRNSSQAYYVKGLSTTSTTGSSVTTTSGVGAATTTKAASTTTTTTKATTTSTTTTTTTTVVQGKPVFQLSETEAYFDDAVNGVQEVTVSVAGADRLYCNTLLYVYFDKRMSIYGAPAAGEALSGLTTGYAAGDTNDFVVLTSSGSADLGTDGVMWKLYFKLPADCKVGDSFSFEVGSSKYGEIAPLFTNAEFDDRGTALQEHLFSGKSYSGSIKVIENPPYKLGDVNNDSYVDAVDASMILWEYALLSSEQDGIFDERQSIAADVNLDGFIDAVDASIVLAYYAHVSSGGTGELEDFIKEQI